MFRTHTCNSDRRNVFRIRASIQILILGLIRTHPDLTFHTHARPHVQGCWTQDEDVNLLKLTNEHGVANWRTIATDLGGGRSAIQCFERYQRKLNEELTRTTWSAAEDRLLADCVRMYGSAKGSWQITANCLEGRSASQCNERWKKAVNPVTRKGKWDSLEERQLYLAVRSFGTLNPNWAEV